jgi:small-conductance mechanosensitive channel
MEAYTVQIIETAVALFAYFVSRIVLRHFVQNTIVRHYFKNVERRDVMRIIQLLLGIVFLIVVVAIWSVKQENVLIVISSLLTVFGVALFAEMSILSNITACLILFFQHPVKVGDVIRTTSEGAEIEGTLVDITYFFVFIRTSTGATVTLPNALLLKSSFTILAHETATVSTANPTE